MDEALPSRQRPPETTWAEIGGYYREDAKYPAAIVNITNRCNLSCTHCFIYREGNPNESPVSVRDEMSDETILDLLTRLRDRHEIRLMLWMGGEPLLRRELLEKGVRLFQGNTITTNGTVPLVDFGPNVLYVVSLDGPEDVNDAIRGRGVYRRVLRNLSRLPSGFSSPYQVQCAVTKRNQDRLEEMVEAMHAEKIPWMTFSFYVPRSADESEDAWRDNEEREGAVREVMRLKGRYPGFIRNGMRSLELMLAANAEEVTRRCPPRDIILPLYLEGDHFTTPFCCYGNDVDCERCGAWAVFHLAARQGLVPIEGVR
jgi:MoaA/NifB/PqqE/SkfB family radical SAM enzyme